MTTKKSKIDLSSRFMFPGKLTVVRRKERYLAICSENGRWIVLDNNSQTVFLHLLETTDLGEALKRFQGKYEDARKVVTQIVARQLDSMPSKRASTDGAIVMHLYLTNQCNMRCPHCYMLAGCKMENELKTEEIKVIMSNFKNYGGSLVTLSGGEVSLRDDLIEICQYAYSINLPLEILTNGLKWTDDMIRIIAPTLYRIQVSIDGYDESENKKIRGAGAFEKALSTVDRFVKANIRTDVAITPVFSDDLHNHIDDYLTFALSLEEKYKNGRFKIQFNGEIMDGREIKLTQKQRDYYADFVHKLLSKKYGKDATDSAFISTMLTDTIKDNCNYGNLTIAANGDVYMCAFIPTLKPVGNIRKDSFESLMTLSKAAKAASVVDRLTPCSTCELKYICGGDCRIHHFPDIQDNHIGIKVQCARECTPKVKEMFYDLMLRTNEALFK
jgi:radical SAM protein with 4Fe4S-binding SPASM domain